MNSAGCADLKSLIEIGCPERKVILTTRDGTGEAPIVNEESTDRPRALYVTRPSVAERCSQIPDAAALSQLTDDVVGVIPRLVSDRDDVA
jgi:hypothetical protein